MKRAKGTGSESNKGKYCRDLDKGAEQGKLPDAEERANDMVCTQFARQKAIPRIKIVETVDGAQITTDHNDPSAGITIIYAALGTLNSDFASGLINELLRLTSRGDEPDESRMNYFLSMIEAVEPQDEMEAMLATQMAAIHNAMMSTANRLKRACESETQERAANALTKLARTYTMQLEALRRYRGGGNQTVRVEHVTVNEGGQAIVGNVAHGGRGATEKGGTTS